MFIMRMVRGHSGADGEFYAAGVQQQPQQHGFLQDQGWHEQLNHQSGGHFIPSYHQEQANISSGKL